MPKKPSKETHVHEDASHGEFGHDPQEDVPVADWMPWPVADSSDYLDRPAPVYLGDDGEVIR